MEIKLQPIAKVKNSRTEPIDDHWESIVSEIELADHIPTEAFENISDFSHLETIYYFDKVKNEDIVFRDDQEAIQTIRWLVFSDNEKKTDQTKSDFRQLNY